MLAHPRRQRGIAMNNIPDVKARRQERQQKLESRLYSVYAVRCKVNGKIYVGCTSDVRCRIRSHFQQLQRGQKRSCGTHSGGAAWQRDYDTFGESAFEYYVLQDQISYADKANAEAYWIARLHAKEEEHGYNAQNVILMPIPIPLVEGLPPELATIKKEG